MRVILLFLLLLEFGLAKKVALVIGNSNYSQGYLANPINDAKLIRDTLQNDLDFDVTYEEDLTKHQMREAIRAFSLSIKKEDIALFYYSGHGMQYRNLNYLIPLKANAVTEGQIPVEGVDVSYILGGMEKAKLAILLLDACRNNPFRNFSRSKDKGLAQITSHQRNYIVSYATEAGAVAKDGDGKNSPYALVLSELLTQPMNVTNLFQEVRNRVAKKTNYLQYPYYDPHFIGSFRLSGGEGACSKVVNVPAVYKSVSEKVKVRDKEIKKIPVSAKYGLATEKIKVADSYKIYTWMENGIEKKLKPKIITITKRALVSEGTEKYVVSGENFRKVKTPPVYKTVQVDTVVKDVDISDIPSYVNYKSVVIPVKYTIVKVKKMVTPASLREVTVPAIYKTVTKRVLVSPARQKTVSVPCKELN